MTTVEERLQALGLELPEPAAPAANYVPFVRTRHEVFVSGQVPVKDGKLAFRGKVGTDYTVEEAQEAARLCAINILAVAKAACDGDLNRVKRCVKLGGFVNCTPEFEQHPAVINGASNLAIEIFGDAGRHARVTLGAAALPLNAAVEMLPLSTAPTCAV